MRRAVYGRGTTRPLRQRDIVDGDGCLPVCGHLSAALRPAVVAPPSVSASLMMSAVSLTGAFYHTRKSVDISGYVL